MTRVRQLLICSVACLAAWAAELKPAEDQTVLQIRVRFLDAVKPRSVHLILEGGDGLTRELNLAKREVEKPITIRLGRGKYEIVAEAEHFVPYRSTLEIADAPVMVTAELRPMRAITGTIVDRDTRTAIGGATIRDGRSSEISTGRNGRFVLEVDPEKWPKRLEVRASGYGTRLVTVPPTRANTSLEEIPLMRGSVIVAEIRQVEAGQVIGVDLLKLRSNGRAPDTVVQTHALPKSSSLDRTIRFEDVEPGRYVVMARGASPSQRVGMRVDVSEWEAPPVYVQLAPFQLRLRAMGDGGPLRNSRVILRQHEAFWELRLDMDSEGESTIELWQAGPLSATVESSGHVPFRDRRTLTEAMDSEWLLEMPRLEVTGTVVDAETGAPVPNAKLALDMRSPQRYQLAVTADAGQDGTFRFAPVVPGEHTLEAAAAGYPLAKMTYTFDEGEELRRVTIALERQPSTLLVVTDARGIPLVHADIHVFRDKTSVAFTKSGSDGKVPLFIPDGETRDVYVLPRTGSLGVTRISSGTAEVRLTVTDGTCRLVLRAESKSHEAIPGIMVDVRYNGFLLPDEVMAPLVGRGSRIISDAAGRIVFPHMPPGTYEFQPVAIDRSPVRVIAAPGDNLAVMTFEPARR